MASKYWCRPAFPHGTARTSRRPLISQSQFPEPTGRAGRCTLPQCERLAGAPEGQGPNEGGAMPDIVFVAIGLVVGLAGGGGPGSSPCSPGRGEEPGGEKTPG